ncbi:MAG TPA: PEGA domain-containing protein [Candidatus Aminicenantes bacterium]|nr:PEGA domain-containing protein [Candidatus Aminicenantes bacterium]
MKIVKLSALSMFVLFLGACTIHVPYDTAPGYDFRSYRIVFEVDPDDAMILLNGRLIGEAYEFSMPESALRLQGSRHEIIIKRDGYYEEVVNLRDYDGGRITVRRRLRPLDPRRTVSPAQPSQEPVARTVEPKPLPEDEALPPEEMEAAAEELEMDALNVTLNVQPAEAAIYLDGRFWGIAPASGKIDNLRLRPGNYTIEVARPGYASHKQVIEVKDKPIEINIALKKQ